MRCPSRSPRTHCALTGAPSSSPVSAHATRRGGYTGTFSLDTAVGSLGGDAEWTPRGDWLLPFQGQGNYDAALDAWVGLHSPGYMCACHVQAPKNMHALVERS
ncbi:hypothetical protein ZWY2020_010232 [Hordeum vulgare]|nr:hypothetical protein ZWY2020_010232 [Hordeum vulgare]